jgi:uncharacterized protein
MKSLRALCVAAVGLLVFALPVRAEKVASMPAPTGYVNDYAGVITPAGKAEIEGICREVHAKTKAQIFLVTIKSLEGESVEQFSNDLFHKWKIGEKKTDRGVMLLLAINDHKRRIEVGYGLEGILMDAKVGRIGRDMVPALKDSDYDEAARVGVNAIADAIADDAHVTLTGASNLPDQPPPPVTSAPPSSELSHAGDIAMGVLVGCLFGVFGLIIWAIMRHRSVAYGSSPGYYDPGSVNTFTSSGSSDSSSSSSSDSSSDSGSSDSFSGGDGGDSGGGGASGDW